MFSVNKILGMGVCSSAEDNELTTLTTKRIRLPRTISSSTSRASNVTEDALRRYIDNIYEKYDPNGDNFIERPEVKKIMTEIALKRKKRISENAIEVYV